MGIQLSTLAIRHGRKAAELGVMMTSNVLLNVVHAR
jgi:hypothetical protein